MQSEIVEIKYIYDSCLVYAHLETDEICKYVPAFQLEPLKVYLINVIGTYLRKFNHDSKVYDHGEGQDDHQKCNKSGESGSHVMLVG